MTDDERSVTIDGDEVHIETPVGTATLELQQDAEIANEALVGDGEWSDMDEQKQIRILLGAVDTAFNDWVHDRL